MLNHHSVRVRMHVSIGMSVGERIISLPSLGLSLVQLEVSDDQGGSE